MRRAQQRAIFVYGRGCILEIRKSAYCGFTQCLKIIQKSVILQHCEQRKLRLISDVKNSCAVLPIFCSKIETMEKKTT